LWGLWNIRKKIGIEKNFPKSSNEVFDKIFSFLQKWRLLLKDGDARYLDERIKMLKAWLWEHFGRALRTWKWRVFFVFFLLVVA
jgi:hypothetical protein